MTRSGLFLLMVVFVGMSAEGQVKSFDSVKDETWVTYRLSHPLHKIEAMSKDVNFHVVIDTVKKEIQAVSAQVDVTTFDSGNSNRDSHAMEVIDAIDFPEVTFSGKTMSHSGDSLLVSGDLNFHGIQKNIAVSVIPEWLPAELKVHGEFAVSLTDFKIDRPSLLMIPVSDTLRFSLSAVFQLR